MQCLIPFLNSKDTGETYVSFDCLLKEKKTNISTEKTEPITVKKEQYVLETTYGAELNAAIVSRGLRFIKVATADVDLKNGKVFLNANIEGKKDTILAEPSITQYQANAEMPVNEIKQNAQFDAEVYQLEVENKQIECADNNEAVFMTEITSKPQNAFNIVANIIENNIEVTGEVREKIGKLVNPNDKMFIALRKGWNYISIPYFFKDGKIARVSDFIQWASEQLGKESSEIFTIVSAIIDGKEIDYAVETELNTEQENFLLAEYNNGEIVPIGLKVHSKLDTIIPATAVVELKG